jgi:hypothetical protein
LDLFWVTQGTWGRVKRILELELRVRQMERELKEKDAKLRLVVAVEQERIEMLEKRPIIT